MTYYNRKELFYNTIKSIARSKFTKFEVIVVDDGSSPEHRLEEYIKEFPFLKIIRIEPENKNYVNPCIPFNIGINAALGDIIMLQNPECYHTGDILTHAYKFVNDGNYISYSTYAITENTYKVMLEQIKAGTITTNYLKLLPQRPTGGVDLDGWYNHSIYRPMCYHFCSAISRNNMVKLNGFDERYRDGIGYDDNEFLERIKRLGLNIMIEDDLSVIHQYHETVFYNKPNIMALSEKNMQLFRDMTLKETQIKVN
jgi:glycosyltransferase involved in cell wall biosynthesis